jgi:hypothetical protein
MTATETTIIHARTAPAFIPLIAGAVFLLIQWLVLSDGVLFLIMLPIPLIIMLTTPFQWYKRKKTLIFLTKESIVYKTASWERKMPWNSISKVDLEFRETYTRPVNRNKIGWFMCFRETYGASLCFRTGLFSDADIRNLCAFIIAFGTHAVMDRRIQSLAKSEYHYL